MTPADIELAAERLFIAEATGVQIGLLSIAYPEMTIDDAYAVQAALVTRKLASGRKRIGWKIGLTSRAMQEALKITTPDSGVLFDDMLFENGCSIPAGRFIQPRIETEIAFRMRADLSGADVDAADVLAATGWCAPALEILDTRICRSDPKTKILRSVCDTISDNAANAGIILGQERHDPADIDRRFAGCILTRDGIVEETGLAAGVLGDPATSVAWLVMRLNRYGQGLKAGDIVLSGSFIRPVEALPGSQFHADFGSLGTIVCQFGS
jgi:2-oxo-hept-3-ene-1,7-dioate hydratase